MASGTYNNESYWYIEGTTGSDTLTANHCNHCTAVGLGGNDKVTLNSCNDNEIGFLAGWENVANDTTSNLGGVAKFIQNNIVYFSINEWLAKRPSGRGNNTLKINNSYDNVALMGDGKNTVEIKDSHNNQVRAGNGSNTFTINGGTKNVLVAGYGANNVTISGGSYNMFAADTSQVSKGEKNIIRLTGGSRHIIYTESGDDEIYIEKNAGDEMMIDTGAGNDIINISAGDKHIIWASYEEDVTGEKYSYDGDNTIYITNSDGDMVITGSGADKLNINHADLVEADLGSGRDEITLMNTDGKYATGALCKIHGGAWNDTFTVRAGSKNYQLYGDAGNDTFNISGGSNMNFWGGAANDTFNVTGGTNNRLYGGDSADTFNISAEGQRLILGYGKDVVNITSGDKQQIKANLGINTINIKAGSDHVIQADIDKAASKKKGYTDEQIAAGDGLGYGQDKVYISGSASGVTANLGDGRDYVSVASGSGHKIYTEGWNDTIEISGSTSDSFFNAGDNDDTINIKGGNNNTVVGGRGSDTFNVNWTLGNKLMIDISDYARGDKDKLNIDLDKSSFTFSYQGNCLSLADTKGGLIEIYLSNGLTGSANFEGIKFKGQLLTAAQISQLTGYRTQAAGAMLSFGDNSAASGAATEQFNAQPSVINEKNAFVTENIG